MRAARLWVILLALSLAAAAGCSSSSEATDSGGGATDTATDTVTDTATVTDTGPDTATVTDTATDTDTGTVTDTAADPGPAADPGEPPCEPREEACDGEDNDCDGETDEGFPELCGCGDGTCSAEMGETRPSCPCDCSACGDGTCSPCGESPLTCKQDCCQTPDGTSYCGDGYCMGFGCGEDPRNCSVDCGGECGNGVCERGEHPLWCPKDCKRQVCGNNVCEPTDGGPEECSEDCAAECGDCVCQGTEGWLDCPTDCGFCGDGVCSGCALLREDKQGCPTDCAVPKSRVLTLRPTHDAWVTHDDGVAHGTEPWLMVGVEPMGCDAEDDKNECTKLEPPMVCCPGADALPPFCAPEGACDQGNDPVWSRYRKLRTYIRFDMSEIPEGKITRAVLRMPPTEVVERFGGTPRVIVTALKKIGFDEDEVCEWDELTIADTNGTTWSSLPQNLSKDEDGTWLFDVTKAVRSWTVGDPDLPDHPVHPNCGFHIYDPDFGRPERPLFRRAVFQSKEGGNGPLLAVSVSFDTDRDGHTSDVDCDDDNPDVHPGVTDVCGDGIDNDCSGAADDEVCDGTDNDCDGQIDESEDGQGVAPCGPGEICANHACVRTCKDECPVLNDQACRYDAETAQWIATACAQRDEDPCLEWYDFEPCGVGQHCNYGSCSFNCVDECSEDGVTECSNETRSSGRKMVGLCSDFDEDDCLELGETDLCAPGASCEGGVCGDDGCSDACDQPGRVRCAVPDGESTEHAYVCRDADGDGCLEEEPAADCGEAGCEEPWGCKLGEQ